MRRQVRRIADLPAEVLLDGVIRRTGIRGDDGMVTVTWIEPHHPDLPDHSHPFDQLAFVLAGTIEMRIDGDSHTMGPGDVAVIPANAPHGLRVIGEDTAIVADVFGHARDDYAHLVAWQTQRPCWAEVRSPCTGGAVAVTQMTGEGS